MHAVNSNFGNQPLLTIAIPTYNRAEFLDLCLTRIGEELEILREEQRNSVKIYISNNASTDNTTEIILRHRLNANGEFEVINNPKNIGGEHNVVQCYTSAQTPYVWVLGDDDVILNGGLKKVLDVLSKNNVDLLYLGNYWFQNDYTKSPKISVNQGVVVYNSALEFSRHTNIMLTFISGLIVKNEIVPNCYVSMVEGCNLPQLSWVLPLLRDGKRFAIIHDWVVAAKGGNSGGYGLVKVFGNNLVKITNNILKDMPAVARVIQNGTIVNFFPSFILELRKGNSKFSDKDITEGLKEAFSNNWRYYVFLVPLILLPLPIAGYYHLLLKIIRRLFRSVLV
ncbi:MAG: glycosyltransferase family 2 protein [Gallionella sp.]|jgi:glycosyltransferase involved in cell wall biosynthesis